MADMDGVGAPADGALVGSAAVGGAVLSLDNEAAALAPGWLRSRGSSPTVVVMKRRRRVTGLGGSAELASSAAAAQPSGAGVPGEAQQVKASKVFVVGPIAGAEAGAAMPGTQVATQLEAGSTVPRRRRRRDPLHAAGEVKHLVFERPKAPEAVATVAAARRRAPKVREAGSPEAESVVTYADVMQALERVRQTLGEALRARKARMELEALIRQWE